jgi:hypothetical protein
MTAIPGDVLAFTLVRLAAACLVVFLGWPAYALPLPPGGDPGERRLVGALASLAYLALGVAVLSLLHLFGLLTLVLLLLLPLALRLPRSAQPYALSRSQSQLVWLLGFLELVPELPTRALAGVRRRVRAWAAHVLGRSPLTWSLWLLGLAALGALLALELPFPWSGQNALPQPVADLLSAVTHLLRGHPLHGGVGPLGYPALLEALITLTAANPLALVLLTGAIATLVTWFALWFVAVRLTGRLVPAFAAVAAYALLCLAFARLPVAIDASPFAPALAVWALYFTRMTLTRALPLDRWALALLLALAGLLGVGTFLAAAISSALTALTSALGGGIPRQVWGELPPLLLAALLAALAPLVLGVLLGGTLAPLTAPSVTLPPWGASALLVALWLTLIAVSPRPEGWLHADVAAVLAVVLAYVLVTVAVYFHRLPKLFLVPDVLPVLGSLAAALAVAALGPGPRAAAPWPSPWLWPRPCWCWCALPRPLPPRRHPWLWPSRNTSGWRRPRRAFAGSRWTPSPRA